MPSRALGSHEPTLNLVWCRWCNKKCMHYVKHQSITFYFSIRVLFLLVALAPLIALFIIRNMGSSYILLVIQLRVEKNQCPLKIFSQFKQRMYSVCIESPYLPTTFMSIFPCEWGFTWFSETKTRNKNQK